MVILSENPERRVPLKGDDGVLRAGSLDSARAGGFFELLSVGGSVGYVSDLVDPFRQGGSASFLSANPIPYLRFVAESGWVPWDVGYNEAPV